MLGWYLFIGIALFLLASLLALKTVNKTKQSQQLSKTNLREKSLLSAQEGHFFEQLQRCLPSYFFFPKLTLHNIVTNISQPSAEAEETPAVEELNFAELAQQEITFLVYDETLMLVAALLYEETEFQRWQNQKISSLLAQIDLPCLRLSKTIPAAQVASEIKKLVTKRRMSALL